MNLTKSMIKELITKLYQNQDDELFNEVADNKEIMIALMKKDIFLYRRASLNIRSDKNLALKVLKREGILLDSVAPELISDEDVVLTAVSNYGYALEYASPELKDNKNIVLAAIKRSPRALTFASARLRKDIDLINVAFSLGGPFIIEPEAFACFQRIVRDAYMYEKSNSSYFKKNKIYDYCIKFNEGKITGKEMMEFQEMLMERCEAESRISKLQDAFNID